jgi:MFS family permease
MALPVTTADRSRTLQIGALGAAGALLGVALSGPLAVALVTATHPQPAWRDAELYARHYHPVQILPYAGGIVLVASLILLLATLHALARERAKALTAAALVFTAAFAGFIFFNYVAQTTFVPDLARQYNPGNAALIAALSMTNPRSLAWGIEMWGWGFLGVATWLASPVFERRGLERGAALAFAANGPVSLAGAVWTVLRPGWVMMPVGLAMFAAWNLLLAAMAVLALLTFRSRLRAGETSSG